MTTKRFKNALMKCWGIDMDDIIRIGQVSEVNESEHMVRVHFADVDIVSGWLKVIRSPPFIPKKGVAQETETADLHKHEIKIAPWFPDIGDTVLCIYNPGFNEDGYVMGAL
nr:MAG TPA: type VI secretion protein [Caudoviricetes sp.]